MRVSFSSLSVTWCECTVCVHGHTSRCFSAKLSDRREKFLEARKILLCINASKWKQGKPCS